MADGWLTNSWRMLTVVELLENCQVLEYSVRSTIDIIVHLKLEDIPYCSFSFFLIKGKGKER
jgi:hypothetical protein